ncbi:glycosyltransferase family 2 protein [Morganella morganii]|nr:glycosyltransferase family 2 protein [Morganella morganii]
MKDPLVSIIMPSYNSSATIEESIQSVLKQTYKNYELIICDDNSVDNTIDIIEKYNSPNITIIKNRYPKGAAGARNFAIQNSSGEYIAFLDSDDLWEETKLEKQINFMNSNNIKFCYGNYFIFEKEKIKGKFIAPQKLTYHDLLKTCHIGCLTVILHRTLLQPEPFPYSEKEDYQLWLNLLKKEEIAFNYNGCNSFYRKSSSSLSSNKFREILRQWRVIRNQKIKILRSIYYILTYIFHGLIKHTIKYKRRDF